MRSIRKLKRISPPLLLILAAVALLGLSSGSWLRVSNIRSIDLQTPANEIMADCKNAKQADVYNQACYNDQIPKIMDKYSLSLDQAFGVIKLIQAQDHNFYYCHIASHEIVAKVIARNPDSWKDVFASCPDDMCSEGCLHGAFQEHFKTDRLTDDELTKLIPELQNICEDRPGWKPTILQRNSCYHGIGHVTMYMTGANVKKSVDTCSAVAIKPDGRDYLQTCMEGIFMQVFQPREPEDIALVKGVTPTADQSSSFCDQFASAPVARAACHRESWVLHEDSIKTPQGLVAFCSYTSDHTERWLCLDKMFGTAMTLRSLDTTQMIPFCLAVPTDNQSQCLATLAQRLVTADETLIGKAVSVCQEADRLGFGDECFTKLANYASYVTTPGSNDFKKYCQNFPASWQSKCLGVQAK